LEAFLKTVPYKLSKTADTNPNSMVCEFTLTNTETAKQKKADLFIDDGSQKELILPAYDALRLGLKQMCVINLACVRVAVFCSPFPIFRRGASSITGATGASANIVKFSPVCVTCTLKHPRTHQEVQKQEFLSVYVWEQGLAEAQAKFDAKVQSEAEAAPPDEKEESAPASTPSKKRPATEMEPIDISPVRHKFNLLQSAIIGKPGLAKLKLIVDPNHDKLYMLFDDDAVY
jgi:hypothetical protein